MPLRPRRIRTLFAALVCAAFAFGLAPPVPAADMTPADVVGVESPGPLVPLGRDDTSGAAVVAKTFVEAIEGGDGDRLLSVLHGETLIGRIADGMPFTDSERMDFERGMQVLLGNIARIIASSAPEGFEGRYRGLLQREGRIHALVRLDMGERGLNYFELSLGRSSDGRVWVYDWYDYAQGSLYSESVRQLGALASGDPAVMASTGGVEGADADAARLAAQFIGRIHAGQLEEALEAWHDLPPAIARSEPILLQRVKVASMLGDERAHRMALTDLATYHGKDPRLALSLVDHYYYSGQSEALFTALGAMSRYMGVRDAGLVNLEGAYHELLGHHAEAEKLAREAIDSEPSYESAHWVLVQALLGLGRYADVTQALETIETRFGYEIDPDQLAAQPMYAEFARSESFRDWKAGRAMPAAHE
jgi:tetratricopeptide (TPR) repeat protein